MPALCIMESLLSRIYMPVVPTTTIVPNIMTTDKIQIGPTGVIIAVKPKTLPLVFLTAIVIASAACGSSA